MSKTENISNLISEERENQNFIINSNDNKNEILKVTNDQPHLIKKYSIDVLNYLKDDIMHFFKQKFEEYSNNVNENILKINKIEKNFEEMTQNININYNKIINNQAIIQSGLDKLKNYESFSNNVNDKLISHEVRLNNFREEFSKAIQKYDKIYLDNLELPGYIGRCAKYKNCQIFFNEIIKNLGTLNQFREKNLIDLRGYKEKLESIIKSFHILVDNNNQAQMKYINSLNEKNIKDCKNMLEILDEKIRDVKVENVKYSVDIMKKTEEMNKKWDKIEKIKDEILGEFDIRSNEYKKLNNDTIEKFNEFKKEYKIIRDKFFELADFIKDIRFQKNIKNIYSQILYRKNIKNICKSLNDLEEIKNNKVDVKDLELIKNISTIEKMNFKINKNDIFEKNVNTSQEISHEDYNEIKPTKNNLIKKTVEYNSPYKFNKISRNDKLSLIKNNKTMDYSRSFNNKDIKNLTIYKNSNDNRIEIEKEKDKEDSKTSINNNYIKKKGSQKIVIESKFDTSLLSTNKNVKKTNNEDSNSPAPDNQSTNLISNNSNSNNLNENNNTISFATVNAFSLNSNNDNKNILINDKDTDNNYKVIKEMSAELEQSTAKKDYNTYKEKETIKPKNLNKVIQEEKENINSANSYKFRENNIFKNIYNKIDKSNNNKNDILNLQKDIKPKLSKEKNELILYGNNPKAIDKKFFMTDKKLLDLEEFTKDKLTEIKNQIENLKTTNTQNNNNNNNNQQKSIKSNNIMTFNSYMEKGNTSTNNNTTINTRNELNNYSFTNNTSNKFKFLNSKIIENKTTRKILDNNKKEFDLTCHNFKKSKFYNLEQINQKIINSSCKKIKANIVEEKEKEIEIDKDKNIVSSKPKDYIKTKIISRNDISDLEPKRSENNIFYEKKKWETNDGIKLKNNEKKLQKNRNISSGNIYLTQKNGENVPFNDADIKLVYLNKFVNNKLPYAPNDAFLGEKK